MIVKKKTMGQSKKIDKFSFNLEDQLGQGAFGTVYLGKNDETSEKVAIKVINSKILSDPRMMESLKNEVEILKSISTSIGVVKLHDVLSTTNNTYIVQEFCNGGDLADFLKKRKTIKESEAIKVLKNLLSGFQVLIKKGIIHRDLKPANILIHNDEFKIADFGFAKNVENFRREVLTSTLGTPLYIFFFIYYSLYTYK